MRRTLVVAALVVVAAGGGAGYFVLARREPPHPRLAGSGPSEHATGMDEAMGAVLAQYDAPDGGTPCETAFIAFKVSQDYAVEHHAQGVVVWLAPRQDFLDRCAALPSAVQVCLAPRYLLRHRDECDKVKPTREIADTLVKLKVPGGPSVAEPGL